MKKLFNTTKINTLSVNNHFFVPPMDTYSADEINGDFNFIHYDHYSGFAQGGFKTIIIESNAVSFSGRLSENDIVLNYDSDLTTYNKMIQNVHRYGAKIGVQINHGGEKSVGSNIFAKQYSQAKIDEIISQFKCSIEIANKDLDVDFIEIHGAHGYFLDQIVTSRDNNNWSFEQKKEIVTQILDFALSLNKPVGIRINAIDLQTHYNVNSPIIQTWAKILNEYEQQLEYISITSHDEARIGQHYNLEALSIAKQYLTSENLISCAGVTNYEQAELYYNNGANLVGIGTAAFLNKNILFTFASRDDIIDQNEFKTLVRLHTRENNE